MKRIDPNLKDWAEALYYGMKNNIHEESTLKWLEAELKDIANRYYQKGYEQGFIDGDIDGWWMVQKECKPF